MFSQVSLALPLYRYRNDLRVHFPQMACIIVPNCVLSLLFWPLIPGQLAMGLPWERAVVFAGRFMSSKYNNIIVINILTAGIISQFQLRLR